MTDEKTRAFEAYREQQRAMFEAFYALVMSNPGWEVLEREIALTGMMMKEASWLPPSLPDGGAAQ